MCCFLPADILLPKEGTDLSKFACVACDQFTSEPSYWNELAAYVGGEPSALQLILPEIYLKGDNAEDILRINGNMRSYLSQGLLREYPGSYILTVRGMPGGKRRIGLIGAVDLEGYSCRAGDRPPVRATEGTVQSRIPPRVTIRRDAPLELPHILLLIDDERRTVIEPLFAARKTEDRLYDFELNMGGGHLEGYLVRDTGKAVEALGGLRESCRQKYGEDILLLVGDGNHSLAAAKACWEELRGALPEAERISHPARYALAEIVNVYDEGLEFEPIHRVVFGAGRDFPEKLIARFGASENGAGEVYAGGKSVRIALSENAANAVDAAQRFIDGYIAENAGSVDYVHGRESALEVCRSCGGTAVLLPAMDKKDLFGHIIKYGALPRKTFSIGEAREKRYYLESRKIRR
jgi:hypothetical protein